MKKKLARLAALCAAGVMVFGLAACGGNSSDSATSDGGTQAGGDNVVTVGFVYPKTGALAAFGANCEEFTDYAVECANAQGITIDGQAATIQVVYADSESDATKASEAANNLINKGIDLMMTSKTADTTVPVAAACERAGIVCLSVDTPDEAWATSDYKYSFHAGFNTENELSSFKDAWDMAGTNQKVAVMHATDTEGQTMINAFSDFAEANGYTAYDPGAYTSGATDYSSIINNIKNEGCDVIAGVMLTSDYGTFYKQLASSGYSPKVITVAKATLFAEDVASVGSDGLANGLCHETWWTADYPYVSSIDGASCADIGAKWMEMTGDSYAPATCGYNYANVEIVAAVLNAAGTLDTDALVEAATNLNLDTVIGTVAYNEQHYSVQPLTTGQWIYDKDSDSWTNEIVANTQVPDCPISADLVILGE